MADLSIEERVKVLSEAVYRLVEVVEEESDPEKIVSRRHLGDIRTDCNQASSGVGNPPEKAKTAFEKWCGNCSSSWRDLRLEGWNAALDAAMVHYSEFVDYEFLKESPE